MVDVDVSNEKLYERWLSIVQTATNCNKEQAKELFEKSNHNAKAAICMYKLSIPFQKAMSLLEEYSGSVKEVIKNS